jgi:hypothetical protein
MNRLRLATGSGLALVALAAVVSSASAGLGEVATHSLGSSRGLQYRAGSYSPWGAPSDIVMYAYCESTAAVVAGGAAISGTPSASRIGGSAPQDNGDLDAKPDDYWVAEAQNLEGGAKEITEYAVCRQSGSGGLHYPSKTVSGIQIGDTIEAKAKCPAASKVIGGGPFGGYGNLSTSTRADGDDHNDKADDAWRVKERSDNGYYPTVTVYAVCIDTRRADVTYRSEAGETKAGDSRTLKADCPAGTAVAGGGFSIKGAAASRFVHSTKPRDSGDGNDVPEDGWQATAVNEGGSKAATKVTAICLN